MIVWLLHSAAGRGIIKHDLAITNVSLAVNLPEDGGTGPVFGGTDEVGVDEFSNYRFVENGGKPGDEMIVRE